MGSLTKIVVTVLALCLLAGCATTGDFCDVARPIYGAKSDQKNASDQLIEGVVSHNTYGARHCGWK